MHSSGTDVMSRLGSLSKRLRLRKAGVFKLQNIAVKSRYARDQATKIHMFCPALVGIVNDRGLGLWI